MINHKIFLLAIFSAVTIAGAQPRSAISTAKNTANAANARNAAVEEQQKAAVKQAPAVRDSVKAGGAAATPAQPAPAAPAGIVAAAPAAPQQRTVPTITREIFQYDGGGRRDPMLSLVRTGALRPHISELALKIVMVGAGERGVATIVDTSAKVKYVVKVGDLLGRYRVVQIDAKSVTFAIEEFGYSRQERLAMGDTSKVRNQ